MFNYLANPTRFRKIATFILPFLEVICLLSLGYGLYLALLVSPPDYQQGDAVRIMYVHVPSAWLALSSYLLLGICSFFFLIWRHPLAEIAARSIAPIGTGFAALTLITGSFWGKPIWGVWWVWDGRLTSMLVLFLFFIGYILYLINKKEKKTFNIIITYLALILPVVFFLFNNFIIFSNS